MKRFEIMEKFDSSKALLNMADGGDPPHPLLNPPLRLNTSSAESVQRAKKKRFSTQKYPASRLQYHIKER